MNRLTILTQPEIIVDLPNSSQYAFSPQRPRANRPALDGSTIRQVGEFDDSTAQTTINVIVDRAVASAVMRAYELTSSCVFTDERGAYEGNFHPYSSPLASGGSKRMLTLDLDVVRRIA